MKTLDATFAALADPTRRQIIARLAQGDASVMDLANPFEMSQPAISKHIRVLERAGLVVRTGAGARRPCRLAPKALRDASAWIERLREIWEERFDALDDVLEDLKREEKKENKK